MKIYEIGTGYTPIPAQMGAATEIVVEELTKSFLQLDVPVEIIDIAAQNRAKNSLPISEVRVPSIFTRTDVHLGVMHKAKRVVYSIALAQNLAKILRQANSKVVLHFHNQYNLFFFLKLVPRKLRKKALIAYTNHSGIWRLPWNEIENTVRKRYFQEAACMKEADIVFALNEETIENAVVHLNIPRDHFVKINNGVNTDVYHPLENSEKLAAKEAFGLPGKRIILQVGSVYENKGQCRSLELLAPIMQNDPDLAYVYVGGIVSEDYHRQLKDQAVRLGLESQVRYLGVIEPGPALNRLYNAAEATIFASKYESFGLVIIESLASGTPVLIEITTPFSFGEGCLLYSKETFVPDVQSRILSNGNTIALAQAARTNAVQNYSWNRIAKDYLDAFN